MSLIVQKFGGSSVRDYAHLLRMARIVKSRVDEGDDVVVVLSAQGDTTDGLLQKAKEISERPSPRELDMLLSAGEQMSAALGAMTLRSIGVEAVSLCAWQIPIETDGTHGNAEIELIDTARIRKELAEGHVVVAAGFQGVDERGDVTTLGRGGSDTSAVALAAALKAAELVIYTDVDGIFSSERCAARGDLVWRHAAARAEGRTGASRPQRGARAGGRRAHHRALVQGRRRGQHRLRNG